MDPCGPAEGVDLSSLNVEALRHAVGIYLVHAYPGVEPPAVVKRRLEWAPGIDAQELLNQSPFEKSNKSRNSTSPVYSLRLGNARYPHMKLQIQPWPNHAGFLLSVNTHDQVLGLDSDATDVSAFRELQVENQRVKEVIEQAWDQAGLPTFLRYLRDYIDERGSHPEHDEPNSS